MGTAIPVTRLDHDAASLRRFAAVGRDANAARRMLALAMVLEGASRRDAARQTGMDRQTLRDWVHRYNSEGLEGLSDRKPSGQDAEVVEAHKKTSPTWSRQSSRRRPVISR
jgi:transposase